MLKSDKPILPFQTGDAYIDVYNEFYNELLVEEEAEEASGRNNKKI